MKHGLSIALAALSLTACYGAAPPRPPRVPLPPVADGAELSVQSESRTTIEQVQRESTTCPQGVGEGDPSCAVTHYTESAPVTRTHTTASLGDTPLTLAQFRVLTDPGYDHKLADLAELSHKCERANVPRLAGLGLFAAALIVGPIVSKYSDAGGVIMAGGLIGGTASYTLGYFAFGGRDCVAAQNLYNDVDETDELNRTDAIGDERAAEMKELSDHFNASHAPGQASASVELRMR